VSGGEFAREARSTDEARGAWVGHIFDIVCALGNARSHSQRARPRAVRAATLNAAATARPSVVAPREALINAVPSEGCRVV